MSPLNPSERERFWSTRYRDAGDEYVFGTAPNRFLTHHAQHLPARGKALSIADGEGRNSVWLAARGLRVTATELSPVALDKARRLTAEQGVDIDFIQADAVTWDYPEASFDVVVGIFFQFANPTERELIFTGMQRTLKPGGWLLLQGYTPKQLEYRTGGPGILEHLYTADLLRTAFADLDIVHLEEYEDVLDEGRGHKGRSALVGLVARKPRPKPSTGSGADGS